MGSGWVKLGPREQVTGFATENEKGKKVVRNMWWYQSLFPFVIPKGRGRAEEREGRREGGKESEATNGICLFLKNQWAIMFFPHTKRHYQVSGEGQIAV